MKRNEHAANRALASAPSNTARDYYTQDRRGAVGDRRRTVQTVAVDQRVSQRRKAEVEREAMIAKLLG